MNIILNNLNEHYKIEQLSRMFIKDIKILKQENTENFDFVYIRRNSFKTIIFIKAEKGNFYKAFKNTDNKNDDIFTVCKFLYECYCKIFNKKLPWGILTGVRPVRYLRDIQEKEKSIEKAKSVFKNDFLVESEKINLTSNILQIQEPILNNIKNDEYSLYVAIPFCPSRCIYCSFISTPVKNMDALMQSYIKKLVEELKYTAKKFKNLKLTTIYIGGGTPTAISENQLEEVMRTIKEHFDFSFLKEYTVEAGRADCTSYEKLEIIKKYSANRISINPQTTNDEVLKVIGRNHTNADFLNCVNMARLIGFNSINMDLIAGLPTDTIQSFETSLKTCIDLKAENITVHALTLKRSSNFNINNIEYKHTQNIANMLKLSNLLYENDYKPYYMYRQKNTVENLENVSYTLNKHESLYNIYIMEEVSNIISCGASGVSKIISKPKQINRIYNYKYPSEYVNDFDTILKRKDEVFNLCQLYGFLKD